MAFSNFFIEHSSGIVKRMRAIYTDDTSIEIIDNAVDKINNFEFDDTREAIFLNLMEYFHICLWIKDVSSMFLFSNAATNKIILASSKAPEWDQNGAFPNDVMAELCMKSDRKVIDENRQIRFIESGVYATGFVILDVVKAPMSVPMGNPHGTIGSAIEVSSITPDWIKKRCKKPVSFEIPMDLELNFEVLNELFGKLIF